MPSLPSKVARALWRGNATSQENSCAMAALPGMGSKAHTEKQSPVRFWEEGVALVPVLSLLPLSRSSLCSQAVRADHRLWYLLQGEVTQQLLKSISKLRFHFNIQHQELSKSLLLLRVFFSQHVFNYGPC